MGRVRTFHEQVRCDASSEMIASASCHVECAEDFFILNVLAAGREFLGSESEFTELANHRVGVESGIMVIDRRLFPGNEACRLNCAIGDREHSQRPVAVAHGELASGVGRNEVNFTSREVCDVRAASAKPVALLSFLLPEFEAKGGGVACD